MTSIGPKEAQVRALKAERCGLPLHHHQMLADALWLKFDLPTITAHPDGSFTYDGPETRPSVTGDKEATMTKRKTKGRKATKTKTARKPRAAKANGENKTGLVAGMLTRAAGCTTAEVLEATKWPAVSMPAMAKAAGLKLTKDKDEATGLTRYRGAPL